MEGTGSGMSDAIRVGCGEMSLASQKNSPGTHGPFSILRDVDDTLLYDRRPTTAKKIGLGNPGGKWTLNEFCRGHCAKISSRKHAVWAEWKQ